MKDDIQCCAGSSLSKEDCEACIVLIKQGGAVDLNSEELPHAEIVAIKRDGQAIVGVGAIKRCRPDYARTIAARSQFKFDPRSYELGYIVVKKSHPRQGQPLSPAIVAALLSKFAKRPLFATTSHERIKQTLRQAGFVPQGEVWRGMSGELSLWIKDGES